MSKSKMIVRTKFVDRACHWTVVICFFAGGGIGDFVLFPTLQWLTETFGTPQMGRIFAPVFWGADFHRVDVYVRALCSPQHPG